MKLLYLFSAQLLIFAFFYLPAQAQTDLPALSQLMANTAKLYDEHPIEKVYLQFDKPYYAVGDTIWFKAYVTIARHQPSPLSKIVYVDILGPRDSLIQSLKLQVRNSVAWSQFPLSQYTYKKGNYRVVAYTNWMNNYSPAYFFNKTITIGDAITNNISTQIAFKTSVVNKLHRISAGITYKDDQGNPFVDKRVSWSVKKDDETIIKGKGVTDKNGYIDISFLNVKNVSLDSASMMTAIENSSRKDITSVFPLKAVARPDDIQFFPEGGALLAGITTKIAFKALKPDGLGIDVKGVIMDNSNNQVAEFSSAHLGMGSFFFKPDDNKTYTVKVTYADGSTAIPDLPKIQTGGINLSIDNSDTDTLRIKLQSDPSFLKDYKGKVFFLLAKSEGVICFAAKTRLEDLLYNSYVPKFKFPTGILQVTLFTPDGEPISERIAFIQHNDQLSLSVNSDHLTYSTRQKVKLNVMATNSNQPDEGNFSVAVIDDSKVPFDENAETTILSYLLLTSDIKGYIEKPGYYFNHPDQKKAADLDNLLLTQGYRRYSYDGLLNNKYPSITTLPEQGINITGTLRLTSGLPVKGGNVRLSIPDKNYFQDAVTDADGRFRFLNLVFLDSAKVSISARNNARASDLVLTIDGEAAQHVPVNLGAPDEIQNIDSTLSKYLTNSKIQYNDQHVLKEVVIRDTRIIKTSSHKDYGSLSSLGEPDHLVSGESLKGCPSVLDCLKALTMGMIFDNDNFYVFRDYSRGKRTPAQVFVKGMPVDVNFLATINPNTIESVEVFFKDELGLVNSANNSNGAIVINLKKIESQQISYQELKNLIPLPNEVTIYPKGYAAAKIFYLPRYDGPRTNQSNRLDLRTTIYWNPNVSTDKTGNASFEYFNADGAGTYRAIVEGFDKDGNIGRQVYRYTVK